MIPLRDTIPSRHAPVMTVLLIAVNAAAFALVLATPRDHVRQLFFAYGIVPARFSGAGFPLHAVWPLLTGMFLHGGWLHLIGNMWTLWIFGDNVEDRMGPLRFLAFYLACGVAAGITHVVVNPGSRVPTVGASGAIAGVMGAYFLLFPHARVLMLLPVFFFPLFFEVPAFVFLAYWFLVQVFAGTLSLAGPSDVAGVAWWAHGGGFVTGALLFPLFLRPRLAERRPH